MKGDQAGSCRFSTRPTGAEGQTRIHRCRLTSVVQALTHDIDNLDEILCQRNRLSASYTSTPHRTASTRGTLSRPAARPSRPPPTPYWFVLSWHCGGRRGHGRRSLGLKRTWPRKLLRRGGHDQAQRCKPVERHHLSAPPPSPRPVRSSREGGWRSCPSGTLDTHCHSQKRSEFFDWDP